MFLENVVRNVETQPRANARRFGRKERFKNALLNFFRNARTIVRDFDDDASFSLIRFDFQFTLALHRIARIIDEIRPHLVQLTAVRFDARQIGRVLLDDAHALFQLVPQNDERIFQSFVHVDFLNRRLIEERDTI